MAYIAVFERVIQSGSIDAKSVANTLVWTNTGATNFVVSGVSVVCPAATSITVAPTVGIGTASGTNDIISAAVLTGLTATTKAYKYQVSGSANVIAPAGTLYANLTVAATGTSQSIMVNVTGYWV